MKKLFLALCATVIGLCSMNAQGFAFRGEFGGNLCNLAQNSKGAPVPMDVTMGLRGGIGLEFAFDKTLYIATGADYRMGGSNVRWDIISYDATDRAKAEVRNTSIAIPLNLGGRIKFSDSFAMSAECGPYFSYLLSSKTKRTVLGNEGDSFDGLDLKDADNIKDGKLKRWSVGFGLSAAMEYKFIYLRGGYALGLTNLAKDDVVPVRKDLNVFFGDYLRENEIYLTLGFRF